MKLTLDREDLEEKYKDINCSQTKFEHFKLEVRASIIMVGKAQFREYDGSNYNAIYAPEWLGDNDGEDCPSCKGEGIHSDETKTWNCSTCKGTGKLYPIRRK